MKCELLYCHNGRNSERLYGFEGCERSRRVTIFVDVFLSFLLSVWLCSLDGCWCCCCCDWSDDDGDDDDVVVVVV